MMKKILYTIIIILVIVIAATSIYFYFFRDSNETPIQNDKVIDNIQNEDGTLNLPTEGNTTIIDTNVETTIRVVNEYDTAFFTTKKNLLIMFASWCPNCQAEISEIEKILEHYKNNKNINVILIAHEYQETITDLITLIENSVNFGNVEVKLDLGRVIRKKIDPEASTIPISYVVDKNGNVLDSYNGSLTLEKAIEMVEK